MNEAVQVFNFGDFEREFGGLDTDSEVSYAIQQFFLNGGSNAWIVRTAAGSPATAAITLQTTPSGSSVLTVQAASPGVWGDSVRLDVDYDTTDPDTLFNLTVTEYTQFEGQATASRIETFRNLSMDSTSSAYAADVVNNDSKLVQIDTGTVGASRPAQTGTVSDDLSELVMTDLDVTHTVDVELDLSPVGSISLGGDTDLTTLTLSGLRAVVQSQLRGLDGLEKATVQLIGSRLRVLTGGDEPNTIVTFNDDSGTLAGQLGLDSGPANVQQNSLGGTSLGAQTGGTAGSDGSEPGATELNGSRASKEGLYALEDVDIFNILCIPRTAGLGDTDAGAVISEALVYCEERRAMMVVDIPDSVNEVQEMSDWLDDNASLRHKNGALYFPRIKVADPLNDYRLRTISPSGTVAGLYARTDGSRGIWKAPSGSEAVLRGVQGLDYKRTDQENGVLNPLGINCMRSFPIYGNVCWGARTMAGSDQQASDWKYVPVRRLALYLEESLFRGTQWIVFEPNDEPLWAQIRLNLGAFMHGLFRQGAFQGASRQEAYYVKCDSETTTQADINLGVVNILVGFAPLKPAEFVVIKIQQMAGQITS